MPKVSEGSERDVLCALFAKIPTETALKLTEALDELSKKYIKEADDINNDDVYSYHHARHAAEMYFDTQLIKEAAREFFDNETQLNLYLKLVQCMHAVHDIVQGTKDPTRS